MKAIIKTLSLSLLFTFTISSHTFAETIKETKNPFSLESGGFPIIGNVNGNLNIKFGFNMENTTFILSGRQIYYFNGPTAISYKDPNGNTIVNSVPQIYEKKLEFQIQERYYPLKKTGLFQPFITIGVGLELPNESSWLPIPIPVILGNIGTDIRFNESLGINLILNASFPRGLCPEANLKLDF